MAREGQQHATAPGSLNSVLSAPMHSSLGSSFPVGAGALSILRQNICEFA